LRRSGVEKYPSLTPVQGSQPSTVVAAQILYVRPLWVLAG
jgi:hypothetical protein